MGSVCDASISAAIASLELEEAELLNRLRSTQEKQRLAYRFVWFCNFSNLKPKPVMFFFAAASSKAPCSCDIMMIVPKIT